MGRGQTFCKGQAVKMDGNIRTDDAWRFRDRLLNPDGTVVKTIKKSTLIWKTTVVKESKRTDKKPIQAWVVATVNDVKKDKVFLKDTEIKHEFADEETKAVIEKLGYQVGAWWLRIRANASVCSNSHSCQYQCPQL